MKIKKKLTWAKHCARCNKIIAQHNKMELCGDCNIRRYRDEMYKNKKFQGFKSTSKFL